MNDDCFEEIAGRTKLEPSLLDRATAILLAAAEGEYDKEGLEARVAAAQTLVGLAIDIPEPYFEDDEERPEVIPLEVAKSAMVRAFRFGAKWRKDNEGKRTPAETSILELLGAS